MPALIASDRLGHATTTAARSGSVLQLSAGKWWATDSQASRKLFPGLGLARRGGRFAKPLDWATSLGGSNPPLSAPTTKADDNPAEVYKHPARRSIARWLIDGVDQASTVLAQGNGD